MNARLILSTATLGALVFAAVPVIAADNCVWGITAHVTPEPNAPAHLTFHSAQGAEETWLFVYADDPGTDKMWSFNPWDGFDDTIPPSLCIHWKPALAVLDDVVYVMGGGSTCAESYLPGVGWEQLADLPISATFASAEVLDGKIYVFGGFGANATHVYDPATDSWTSGPPMAHYGGARASAVVGDKIYAMGGAVNGSSDTGGNTWFEVFQEGAGWTSLDPLPSPRNGARAAPVRAKIYLTGGRTGASPPTVDNRVWVYDTNDAGLGWTEAQSMVQSREFHALGTYGVGLYAVGGRGGDVYHSSVERLITSGDCCLTSDVDGDGDVDLGDLAELLAHYGETCP